MWLLRVGLGFSVVSPDVSHAMHAFGRKPRFGPHVPRLTGHLEPWHLPLSNVMSIANFYFFFHLLWPHNVIYSTVIYGMVTNFGFRISAQSIEIFCRIYDFNPQLQQSF